jgi:hypothetical protein
MRLTGWLPTVANDDVRANMPLLTAERRAFERRNPNVTFAPFAAESLG